MYIAFCIVLGTTTIATTTELPGIHYCTSNIFTSTVTYVLDYVHFKATTGLMLSLESYSRFIFNKLKTISSRVCIVIGDM